VSESSSVYSQFLGPHVYITDVSHTHLHFVHLYVPFCECLV